MGVREYRQNKKNGGEAAKQEKIVGAPLEKKVRGRPRKAEKGPEVAGNGHGDTLSNNLGESTDKFPAKGAPGRPRKKRSKEELDQLAKEEENKVKRAAERELVLVKKKEEEKFKERASTLHKLSEEQWQFAHLELEGIPENLVNPFDEASRLYNNPAEQLLSVMMNPDYFGWGVSKLFNTGISPNGLELLPIQCVVLRELWRRSFPILVASRGFSKTFLLAVYCLLRALLIQGRKIILTGSSFRQSKMVLAYAESIWYNSPILRDICAANKYKSQGPHHDVDVWWIQLGESRVSAIPIGDGCISFGTKTLRQDGFSAIEQDNIKYPVYGNGIFRNVDYHINNGVQPTKKVITKKGYSYEGTYNHAMKVVRNGEIQWVRSDEMVIGDRILIDRSYRWHNGQTDILEDDAYAVGLIIGDGAYFSDDVLSFATNDSELANSISDFVDKCPDSKVRLRWNGEKDKSHYKAGSPILIRWLRGEFGLKKVKGVDKDIPDVFLRSSRNVMTSLIQGLMDSDGSIFYTEKDKKYLRIVFSNTSLNIIDKLQFILLHYGIISQKVSYKPKNNNWNIKYDLVMNGINAFKFAKEIGFRLKRKMDKANLLLGNDYKNIDTDDIPYIKDIMVDIASKNRMKKYTVKYKEISSSRIYKRKTIGLSCVNKFLEAYGNIDDSRLDKIRILANPDIFYDEIVSIEDGEAETFDIYVPDGNEYCANGFFSHNSKIRGMRAHDVISDETASINPEIFEMVVAGFGVVNLDPITQVKHLQRLKYIEKYNLSSHKIERDEGSIVMPNQIILSGTASYTFNHFYRYWKDYRNIITSGGDPQKRAQLGIDETIDYKKYSIFRIPVSLLPEGFMDPAQLARSKQAQSVGIYGNEFGAVFSSDSTGFFKRSIIERSMPTPTNPVVLPTGTEINAFPALLKGDPNKNYIMAIDTASQRDNFAIVILELYADHARIVHCWTSNAQRQLELRQSGLSSEKDFYAYCTQKIRELLKLFNIVHIAMDAQGGGYTIINSLHSGEPPIWELSQDSPLWDGKERPTDDEKGLHIVELVQFTQQEYTGKANHGLKDDLERRVILFPYVDDISYILAGKSDIDHTRTSDTLEELLWEMDQLKDELTIIQVSTTPSGREHWGAPRIKENVDRPGELHDDRYSALLMANYAARRLREIPEQSTEYVLGGFTGTNTHIFPAYAALKDQPLYVGPSWFTNKIGDFYGTGVNGTEGPR